MPQVWWFQRAAPEKLVQARYAHTDDAVFVVSAMLFEDIVQILLVYRQFRMCAEESVVARAL
jgi:hypothetical protein